jgi:uncharacterized membrane protein YdjX (TVP38/TMEM64 family)
MGDARPGEVHEDASEDLPLAAPPGGRKLLVKAGVLVVVLAAAIATAYLSPLRGWLQDAGHVRKVLTGLGFWAYPLCTLVIAALVACGMPRLLFCGLWGMLFGFWPALLVNETATLLAYYGMFLFVRWGGRDFVLHKWPKLQHWADLIQQQGTVGVILARQIPIHGTLINLCLGLSRLRHRDFLLSTAVGIIPEAIPAILIGSGLATARLKDSVTRIVLALVILVAIWLTCRYLMRKRSQKGQMPGKAPNPRI